MAKNEKKYSNLYVKRRLIQLEIDILGLISDGLLSHQPKKQILARVKRQILSIAVQLGLSDPEKNWIWSKSQGLYLKMSRKLFVDRRKGKVSDEDSLYLSVKRQLMDNDFVKNANKVMYDYEYNKKHEEIWGVNGIIESNRRSEDSSNRAYSPFFLASAHRNAACGHKPYQGKMYYDEKWEEYCDAADADRIRAYIRNHDLMSIQEVCSEPIYFMTRRNCKHYFKKVPLEEVLHSSVRKLLKVNKMVSENEVVSERTLRYRDYYNRTKVMVAVNDKINSPELEKDIKRSRKLLQKYK